MTRSGSIVGISMSVALSDKAKKITLIYCVVRCSSSLYFSHEINVYEGFIGIVDWVNYKFKWLR